jgi:tetratricopeptide (TPR) repeat protein
MFKDMIKAEKDEAKQNELAEMKVKNHQLRLEHFPQKSPVGLIYSEIGEDMYNYNLGTSDEQFKYLDDAWKQDAANFKSPKGLYIYFLLLNQLEDEGKKEINELFVKYDELIAQIEGMENEQAIIAKTMLAKKEDQQKLTKSEARQLKNSGIYLDNYAKIKKGISGVLGQKADCDNLIPLYTKDFEAKKTNKDWLKVAASRMNAKDCTSDPLFFNLVEALHNLEPSAKTAFYLGRLAMDNGDSNKGLEYFKNAAELEENPLDKAKAYFSIAETYKKRGSLSQAKSYYERALEYKPSMGIAYLRIASMIASSANDCGETTFDKQAVYWKAEKYARRAASVDASLRSNANETAESYSQRAPSKADIFQNDMQGKTINFSCWFGGSIKVPTL